MTIRQDYITFKLMSVVVEGGLGKGLHDFISNRAGNEENERDHHWDEQRSAQQVQNAETENDQDHFQTLNQDIILLSVFFHGGSSSDIG